MKRYTSLITAVGLLTILPTLQTQAAENAWNNGSGNSFWDLSSANWGCPPIWAEGDNAYFDVAGANPSGLGTSATLNSPITAHNVTVNGTNYVITGGGNLLTLAGTTPTIISSASSNNFAVSIFGTDGLTFQGTGTTALLGDSALAPNLGNTYTGGTHVRSGTLILGVGAFGGAALSSSSYAVDSIEAIDVGATVREGNFNDGLDTSSSDKKVPNGQIPISGPGSGLLAPHRLNLTGGTYDTYANDNNQQQPQPSGWGTIINTCPDARGILKYTGYGETTEFAGQIMDGGAIINRANNGPGYQMNVDSQGGSSASVLILSGSNSFTGFIRIGNAATIQLKGAGTLGYPSPIFCPARQIIMNNGVLDLNGTSQKTGYYYCSGVITNTAVGTVSTLTVCYNCTNLTTYTNSGVAKGLLTSIQDDPATSGLIALTKDGVAVQPISGPANNYHGDTVVNNGVLWVQAAGAISPNSAYHLNTTQGQLALDYAGTASVRQLWINGVPKPNGTYGAADTTAITGTGTLTVTDYDFNRWNNASANSMWDGSSANWTSPTIWAVGNSAFFDALGANPSGLGTAVTLNSAITAHQIAVTGTNYIINGGSSTLALAGTTPTITSSASSNNFAVSIVGTEGLSFQGAGTTALLGDSALAPNLGNTYTGGTYVRSGTLILGVGAFGGAALSSSSYAVDSIEAIDVGATVREGNFNDGLDTSSSDKKVPNGQIPISGPGSGLLAPHRLNLTGGTYDTYANDNNQQQPQPSGWGTIINTCPDARGILKYTGYGETTEFAGQIMDGGTTIARANNGPGYQMNVDSQNGPSSSVLILSGSNSFTGFIRIGNNATIQLKGSGTLGYPAPINCPGRQVIMNNGVLDLNGTSQKTGVFWTKGDADGSPAARITNSAFGTLSTLTLCYNATNLTVSTSSGSQGGISCSIKDDPTTGGTMGITKEGVAMQVIGANDGTNSVKGTPVNDYHGDTVVNNGILAMINSSAVSPNSAYRINATQGKLRLDYSDTANVRQLWISGVQQPNGVYGAGTPGIDPTSTGTLTVTGADPTLVFSRSGNTLNLSWAGTGYKLVFATSVTGPWSDYPCGGTSPVAIAIGSGSKFFRLSK